MDSTQNIQIKTLSKVKLSDLEIYTKIKCQEMQVFASQVDQLRDLLVARTRAENPVLIEIQEIIDSRTLVDIYYNANNLTKQFKRVLITGIDKVYSYYPEFTWHVALQGDFGDEYGVHYFELDNFRILPSSKQKELHSYEQA
jgi:hypothetical protein